MHVTEWDVYSVVESGAWLSGTHGLLADWSQPAPPRPSGVQLVTPSS